MYRRSGGALGAAVRSCVNVANTRHSRNFVKRGGSLSQSQPITPLQARLARAALGLSLRDLGAATGLAPNTITRFELGKGGVHAANLGRLQDVFEQRGVVFLPSDEIGEATVRLRHASQP